MQGQTSYRIGLRSVFPVAGNWVSYVFGMSPYLVFPACLKFEFHECVVMTVCQSPSRAL